MEHFKKGVEFFEEEDYNAALAEFLESNRIKPNIALKYNIGICYHMTNRYTKSLKELTEYLELGKDKIPAERREEVEALVKEIQGKLGKVVFCCSLGHVAVIVDDTEKHEVYSEQEIELDPGVHKIRIHKKGFKDFAIDVVIASGETAKKIVKLKPLAGEEGAEKKETGKKKKRPKELRWLWIGLGVGGAVVLASLGTGIAAYVYNNKRKDKINTCPPNPDRENCPGAFEYNDLKEDLQLSSELLAAGAVAVIGTGLILCFVGVSPWKKKKKKEKGNVTAGVTLLPDPGLTLRIDF